MKEENTSLRREVDRWRAEKEAAEDAAAELRRELARERELRRAGEEEGRDVRESWQRDQAHSAQLIQELSREVTGVDHRFIYYILLVYLGVDALSVHIFEREASKCS